jgi:NitT/TauT family transport system substrate-binding protein
MKSFGLVTGADAARDGILSMTDARWRATRDFMVAEGLLAPGADWRKAYSLELSRNLRVLP